MIEAPDLKLPGIRHGFFTRQGGCSDGIFASLNCGLGSGDDAERVKRNRASVAEKLDVAAERLVTVYQHHSRDVIEVSEPWATSDRPRADAMVTSKRGLAIGVLTADCGPILFAEEGVIGAAHAGWKGALGGVTESTLAAMEKLGARRERVVAILGPTISKEAYEVGPEFPALFPEADAKFFRPSTRAHHSYFDLPGYLTARLKSEGVGHVVNLGLCTYADEARFFSFRRATHRGERDYGRQISAIALA